MNNQTETASIKMGGLLYKVVTIGETKFARYKPLNEWLGSTKAVHLIESALARKHGEGYVIRTEKVTAKDTVLEILTDSEPLSMAQLMQKIGRAYSKITVRNALRDLVPNVEKLARSECPVSKRMSVKWGMAV